jgi:hypothetical protein
VGGRRLKYVVVVCVGEVRAGARGPARASIARCVCSLGEDSRAARVPLTLGCLLVSLTAVSRDGHCAIAATRWCPRRQMLWAG